MNYVLDRHFNDMCRRSFQF